MIGKNSNAVLEEAAPSISGIDPALDGAESVVYFLGAFLRGYKAGTKQELIERARAAVKACDEYSAHLNILIHEYENI